MKCFICGYENNDQNIYCLNCGNKLTEYEIDKRYNNLSTNTFNKKELFKIIILIVIVVISFILLASTITSDIMLFNNTTNNTQSNATNYSQYYSQMNNTNVTYLGNKNSQKFHYPNCLSAQNIKPEHLIVFQSRDEAIGQGYVPCKQCNP